MEILKLLSASEIAAHIVSFLILLWIMKTFLWKRLLGIIDKRRERIASELKSIEAAREAVDSMTADYEAKLKVIDETAKSRIREAIAEAERMILDMKKAAHVEAKKIIDEARANVRYEAARATEEVRGRIIDIVMRATERVIEERISTEDDRKIVNDFLAGLDRM